MTLTLAVTRLGAALAVGVLLSLGSACGDMSAQPKQTAYGPLAAPIPAPATVEFDSRAPPPPALTQALMERGQSRYRIFCTPCHGETGDGGGMIVQRGFPRPPSLLADPLRHAPTQHVVDVIANGYGVMYSFAQRIPAVDDRWAIAAYVRALQRADSP